MGERTAGAGAGADRRSRAAARNPAGEARATRERLGGLGIDGRDPALVGRQARHPPPAGGARGALPAAVRGLPPARHPASADGAPRRRPGRDRGHARAHARAGPTGLAGMAAIVEHRDVRLLRPLLGVPRGRLTATLEARGVGWIDDPSNEDRRFERVRVRQDGGACRRSSADRRSAAARDRELAEAALRGPRGRAGRASPWITCSCRGLSKEIAGRLLGRVVQAVGGRRLSAAAGPAGARGGTAFAGRAVRGKSGKSQDFTLSGCQLMLRRDPGSRRLRWIVRPESGRRHEKKPGQPLVPAAFFACGASAAPHVD